jgi:hypothetical protein
MRLFIARAIPFALAVAVAAPVAGQARPAAAQADVYHVMFLKAVPGQAEALAKELVTPDPKAPMPTHFIVFRHQEGDDWDYCVLAHVGPRGTVDPAPPPAPTGPSLVAWHNDTFVSGPSWADVTAAMGLGTAGSAASAVYAVSVHRAAPGHREQLEKALAPPPAGSSKIQTGDLIFRHIEGGDWQLLAVTRYNSWQDFATDRSQPAAGPGGWADIRQHSAFHRDTIADRLAPK